MAENLYDKGSRYLVGFDPTGFFCWLLGLKDETFRFDGWLETRAVVVPGERDLTGDKIARLVNLLEHGVPWALLVEFQIEPDAAMFGRLLRHLGSIWQSERPDEERGSRYCVAAAVVNLTGRGSCSQEQRWPQAGLTTHLGVVERNLQHERAEDLLAGVEAGTWPRLLLPFTPLMMGGEKSDMIEKWMVLAAAEPDPGRRSDYAAITLQFAERAGRKDLWDEKLKGWGIDFPKNVG